MENEEQPVIATKPPKKPRSEAQKKATENALNILKARREAKKEERIRAEKPVAAKQEEPRERNSVAHSHSERNLTDYVTKKDLEAYMAGMQTMSHKAKKKPEPVPDSSSESEEEEVVVVKKSKPRPAAPVAKEPVKLSGYALLDEMFFSRR